MVQQSKVKLDGSDLWLSDQIVDSRLKPRSLVERKDEDFMGDLQLSGVKRPIHSYCIEVATSSLPTTNLILLPN